MGIKSKYLDQFTEWLEKELREKGKISLDEVLISGAQKMNCTIDDARKYLGKALIIRTGQIKLNLDESKGMKFLEYRGDFHYTGDRREHEDFEGTEDQKEKGVAPSSPEDSERNIYDMKDEGDSEEDKDSEEDIEKEE